MHCIVIVRYSILTIAGSQSWWIGRRQNYRETLFARSRLDLHQYLFEHLTLPSLVRQTRPPSADWFRLVVLTSTELPQPYRANLDAMLAPFPWARVVTRAPEDPFNLCTAVPPIAEEFAKASGGPVIYATARLDDDDALSRRFFELLGRHVGPETVGSAVSLASGYFGEFDWRARRFTGFSRQCLPKIAAGLAMVHRFDPHTGTREPECVCIYGAGNHNLIYKKFNLIVDSSEPAYLRTLHPGSDSYRPGRIGTELCSADEVGESFDLLQ